MSQRPDQRQKTFKFWFPYWNNPIPTRSPERTQPQRSPNQSRSSTSQQQPTASSVPASSPQRSQPSVPPSSSSRKSSAQTNTNDPTRKQQPSKSNAPTKPSSPSRFKVKIKEQDPMNLLGKPVEKAALLLQNDRSNEKSKRDEQKKPEETKAVEAPKLEVGQPDLEPKPNLDERSEEGTLVQTNKSDLEPKVVVGTLVKQNEVEGEEAKPAYPEPFRQDLGNSDQQKSIKKPQEFPDLTTKQSNLEPQPQTEASNQPKVVYEKPEEVIGTRTMQTDSISKQNIEPSNKQKQHETTENIPKISTYQLPNPIANQELQGFIKQKETAEKPSGMSEGMSNPDLETDRGRKQELFNGGKTRTKTEILGKLRSSTGEKAQDSQVERDYAIMGDQADEPRLKNGGPIHAAREKPGDKGNTTAKVKNGHESGEKVSKVSISTGPWVAFADGERADFQKEIKEGLSKLVDKLNIRHSGHHRTDPGVSIITLAGKNKGAIMKIGNKSATGSKKSKDEQQHNDEEMKEMAASVNSNVQSINNSFLNESKCEERNPGVHLVLSVKPTEVGSLKKKMETLASQNSSLSMPTPQKLLSYEPPSVRRRCLRGLMMEPSEDEEDGVKKPRRHGCRVGVGCDEKRNGKENSDESISKPN